MFSRCISRPRIFIGICPAHTFATITGFWTSRRSNSSRARKRVRKMGGRTLRSVQHIVRLARLSGNEADFVAPSQMLAELRSDNEGLAGFMRDTHFVCGGVDDVASMSVLENWIDEAERRVWFLLECGRKA